MKTKEMPTVDTNKSLLQGLKEKFDLGKTYYGPEQRKMKLLDATDKGKMWEALGAKFPPYQILPDTNFVSYIKTNILASIYTVAKSAEVIQTSQDDADICMKLNIALERVWDLCSVGFYQFQAGERAALLNLGLTQVGWSESFTEGTGNSFIKGNISLKNIDPMKYMRDPFAASIETAGWACTYDEFHKSVFLADKRYKEKFQAFLDSKKQGQTESIPKYDTERPQNVSEDHFTLITYWVREDDGSLSEYHTLDNNVLLYEKKNLKPNVIPIAELYCNLRGSLLVGVSEPLRIFANNVAANLMDSIALTAEYKNQRPPKFVNSASGLNIAAFTRHGDEADRTFVVNGDASKAVHYHEFPFASPQLTALRQNLQYSIENTSGIDGRYTGRDTGSIITTGGTEEMLNRVTLIDAPKVLLYEQYAKRLSMLILNTLLEHAPKRSYLYKKPQSTKWETIEVDFPKIDSKTAMQYSISISSELPKNKQRIAAMANMLMEKQMQYQEQGNSVDLITEEEWLRLQDIPNKEYMLERMGFQRETNALTETSQVLYGYAKLVEGGMPPEQALAATAEMLKQSRMGQMPDPTPIDIMQQQAAMAPQPAIDPAAGAMMV